MNDQTNEGVCVDCWTILYNSHMDEKIAVKFLVYVYEIGKWNL